MAGLTGVSGVTGNGALGRIEFEAQFQAAALRNQQDVQELLGQQSLQLIQSAAITSPDIGNNLDVLA